jgi:predicted 3-demethylubiquinone-9 3-methyltransferase (glyoxalase superfamily)
MMAGPDQAKARRVADTMMKMVKFDIAALKVAYSGTTD